MLADLDSRVLLSTTGFEIQDHGRLVVQALARTCSPGEFFLPLHQQRVVLPYSPNAVPASAR